MTNIFSPPLTFTYLPSIVPIPEHLTTYNYFSVSLFFYFHISKYACIVIYSFTNFGPIHFCRVYVDENLAPLYLLSRLTLLISATWL